MKIVRDDHAGPRANGKWKGKKQSKGGGEEEDDGRVLLTRVLISGPSFTIIWLVPSDAFSRRSAEQR